MDAKTSLKRLFFEHLLGEGDVFIQFNGRGDGVVIPENAVADAVLLQYNLNFAGKPMTDLKTSDEGVGAVLSIKQTPVKTFVPWRHVFSVQNVADAPTPSFKMLFFGEDKMTGKAARENAGEASAEKPKPPKPPRASHLRSV